MLLGADPDLADPYASPISADLTGLPPADPARPGKYRNALFHPRSVSPPILPVVQPLLQI
jgi:hypothetical protein